jgi:hypothetical protein
LRMASTRMLFMAMLYRILADSVLLVHFGIVVFVVGGLVLIVVGNALAWRWVNGIPLRIAHGAAIAVVVAESWLGVTCPLTTLESALRVRAGTLPYQRSFIEDWVQSLLFYEAPAWVFTSAYTAFGLLVVLVWWRFPPTRERTAPSP